MKSFFVLLSLVIFMSFTMNTSAEGPSRIPPNPQCPKGSKKISHDLSDCTRYWKCENGEANNYRCPNDEFFDAELLV